MYSLLRRVYDRAATDCDIDICFRPDEEGRQNNPCRSLIIEYAENSSIGPARAIASRLQEMTDRRSGLGLLFLVSGHDGNTRSLMLSRFPTDEGISADESEEGLNVQYLERVFMKNKHSYKAVFYKDRSFRTGFWTGHAVDRQNTDYGMSFSSNYWISDFLCSDLSITAAAGSRRFGVALRDAMKKSDPVVRRELAAAATLVTGLRNQSVSISALADRFSLSSDARTAVTNELKTETAANERFRFDETEFNAVVGFLSVELDNKAIMTAPSAEFNDIFTRRQMRGSEDVEFTTCGRIIGEKLKRST